MIPAPPDEGSILALWYLIVAAVIAVLRSWRATARVPFLFLFFGAREKESTRAPPNPTTRHLAKKKGEAGTATTPDVPLAVGRPLLGPDVPPCL